MLRGGYYDVAAIESEQELVPVKLRFRRKELRQLDRNVFPMVVQYQDEFERSSKRQRVAASARRRRRRRQENTENIDPQDVAWKQGETHVYDDEQQFDDDQDDDEDISITVEFWLAKALAQGKFGAVQSPKMLSKSARSNLLADATVCSLQSLGDFYNVGMQIGQLTGDAQLRPGKHGLLYQVFVERYKDILNKSQTWRNIDFSLFLAKLTVSEQKLFFAGRQSALDFTLWKRNRRRALQQSRQIVIAEATASASSSSRKRPRQ
jgi:hypothetical protein